MFGWCVFVYEAFYINTYLSNCNLYNTYIYIRLTPCYNPKALENFIKMFVSPLCI